MGIFTGLLSLKDASEIWNVHDSSIRKAIRSGRFVYGIDACKFGKQWVVTAASMKRVFGGKYDVRKYLQLWDSGRFR